MDGLSRCWNSTQVWRLLTLRRTQSRRLNSCRKAPRLLGNTQQLSPMIGQLHPHLDCSALVAPMQRVSNVLIGLPANHKAVAAHSLAVIAPSRMHLENQSKYCRTQLCCSICSAEWPPSRASTLTQVRRGANTALCVAVPRFAVRESGSVRAVASAISSWSMRI
jgi:hypothetical protein